MTDGACHQAANSRAYDAVYEYGAEQGRRDGLFVLLV